MRITPCTGSSRPSWVPGDPVSKEKEEEREKTRRGRRGREKTVVEEKRKDNHRLTQRLEGGGSRALLRSSKEDQFGVTRGLSR